MSSIEKENLEFNFVYKHSGYKHYMLHVAFYVEHAS